MNDINFRTATAHFPVGAPIIVFHQCYSKHIYQAILFLCRDMKPENILLDDQGKSPPRVLLKFEVSAVCY